MLNWSNFDTLLLDMDGTLLDLNFDNVFWQTEIPKAYAIHRDISLAEAHAYLEPTFAAQRGTLAWYSTDYWSDTLGFDVMAIKHQHSSLIAIHPHVEAFLHYAQQHTPLKIILATNADPHVLQLKMQHTGLASYFDALLTSHELGHAKEDQAFWQELMQQQQLTAERCIFIDDSATVLASAETFGIGQLVAITAPDSQRSEATNNNFGAAIMSQDFAPLLASLQAAYRQ